jgi:hypothetical protein
LVVVSVVHFQVQLRFLEAQVAVAQEHQPRLRFALEQVELQVKVLLEELLLIERGLVVEVLVQLALVLALVMFLAMVESA